MKNIIIEKINGSLHNLENAKATLYRNKCFVVANGERIETIVKTKRGAEGYIKKHGSGYYCEYSFEMVYPSYEIVEILESELIDYNNNFNLWHKELRCYLLEKCTINYLEKYFNNVTNEELKQYITESIDEINKGKGLRMHDKTAQELGFKNANAYHEFKRAEQEKQWAEYEAKRKLEEIEYQKQLEIRNKDIELMNSTSAEVIKSDVEIFIGNIKIASKPSDINEIEEFTSNKNIVINSYLVLKDNEFTALSNNLIADFKPIQKLGGTKVYYKENNIEIDYSKYELDYIYNNKNEFNMYNDSVLITNESKTIFIVVDPQGYNYCRYVGKLTATEGNKILKQLKGETKVNNLQVIENNNTIELDTNVQKCNALYLEIEALEKRLKMVNSAKLKYKIEKEIELKGKEIAKIIVNDEVLYTQFMKEK